MKAVAYARYSSENQDASSITAQLRAIHAYADANGVEIAHEYIDEARSATTDDRPSFKRMLADLGNGLKIDLVLVHKLDRFARNRYDSAIHRREIKQCGARLVAVDQPTDDTPEGALLESLLEGLAEYYSKNLARETMKGLKENAYKAVHNGGIPPLGYNVVDGQYVINKVEAVAVKLVYTMVLEGRGYADIIRELAAKGVRGKRGKPLGKNSIHDMLRNPKYAGTYIYMRGSKYVHRGMRDDAIVVPDAIPAIIPIEEWNQVQNILDKRKKNTRRRNTSYLLTGKITCGLCGSACVGNSGGRKGKMYYYYQCNRAKRTEDCNAPSVSKARLEKVVMDAIKERVFEPSELPIMAAQLAEYSSRREKEMSSIREALVKQARQCEAKMDALVDLIIETATKYERDKLREKLKSLEGQKIALEEELKRTEKKPQFTEDAALKYLQHLNKQLEEPQSGWKIIVNNLLHGITLDKEEVEIALTLGNNSDNVRITVVALTRSGFILNVTKTTPASTYRQE